jgi:serine/threonine protein phosphatase PrpC
MIFIDTKKDIINDEEEIVMVKKIKKAMLDEYKSFMNLKLRGIIYESLDKEFYCEKYGNDKDKIMYFLQKNIDMYVRDNNKQKLIENFETFITLNKIDLKKELGFNMNQLIHEQKRRIETFDIIFSNLVGAFSHIFKNYFDEDQNDVLSRKFKPVYTKVHFSMEDALIQMNNSYLHEKEKMNELKMSVEKKTNIFFNFKKDIKIPPNTEEMDKIIISNNIRNKAQLSKMNASVSPRLYNNMNISNIQKSKIKNNLSYNSEDTTKNSNNKRKPSAKKKQVHRTTIKLKIENFQYRNLNNFLITKLISIFLPIFKIQNGVLIDPNTDLNYAPIIPSKRDLNILNYPNIIKSYSGSSMKGTHSPENQDTFFYYDNFMLIKNCILFGVCDGHGKNGSEISNLIGVLYPTYIFYLIVDNNVIRRKQDINELMIKLYQLEESPEFTKEEHILRYILNKLGVEDSYIPFISGDENGLYNLLYESIHLSHHDLIERYKVDIEYSGTTLCSGILAGNKLYISNIGDSRAVMGVFNNKGNTWTSKQLSISHEPGSPNESKRIIQNNGRIDRLKNEFGDEYGELRVFEKDVESTKPGLSMTRSIGDDAAKKLGIIYEPEIFTYELGNEHRIIVIGTDGLWKYLTNDEVIKIAGKFYDEGAKAEETSKFLVETARNRWIEHIKKDRRDKKDKTVKRHSPVTSNRLRKYDDELIGGNKNEEMMHKKHKKISYDDITCLVIYLYVK